ncbi:MAG: FKBP-type peptidyl-prolyl cis-trans isomerase, partial [Bacteroidota bacterium]|nr:FKBP-type peptidyl-prolyl cis-trans isomerase [Bacteroidota bacterium]
MNIEKNKVIAVAYELRTESHESAVVETTTKEKPLQFIFGKGMMLPIFEEKLEGKANEDSFQFVLQANEAYGEYLEENKFDIPTKAFEVEGKIQDGLLNINNIVSMQDNQGNRFDGK